MAQPDFIAPLPMRPVAPKPKMTIYYALLIIALVAMLIACLLMWLEIRRFGGFGTVSGTASATEPDARTMFADARSNAAQVRPSV